MNQESEDSPLTELKYAGDFMQIQPEECVETPEFYGGKTYNWIFEND